MKFELQTTEGRKIIKLEGKDPEHFILEVGETQVILNKSEKKQLYKAIKAL